MQMSKAARPGRRDTLIRGRMTIPNHGVGGHPVTPLMDEAEQS